MKRTILVAIVWLACMEVRGENTWTPFPGLGPTNGTFIVPGIMDATSDAKVAVSWKFPSATISNQPLTNLVGAIIYLGLSSSNYTHSYHVPGGVPGGVGRYVISNLVEGTKYFINGTAYNTLGRQSDFTDEVVKVATTNAIVWLVPPLNIRFLGLDDFTLQDGPR